MTIQSSSHSDEQPVARPKFPDAAQLRLVEAHVFLPCLYLARNPSPSPQARTNRPAPGASRRGRQAVMLEAGKVRYFHLGFDWMMQ